MLDFTLSVPTVWIGQLLSGFTFLFEQKCVLLVWCLIINLKIIKSLLYKKNLIKWILAQLAQLIVESNVLTPPPKKINKK